MVASHAHVSKDTASGVAAVLRGTLQLSDKADEFTPTSPLLGHVPELDSMAVASVLAGLEEHFDIEIDDDDISAEVFETFGSLCDLVDDKLS